MVHTNINLKNRKIKKDSPASWDDLYSNMEKEATEYIGKKVNIFFSLNINKSIIHMNRLWRQGFREW
jgi:hypothetical protein